MGTYAGQFLALRTRLTQAAGWLDFCEIETTEAGKFFRMVRSPRHVAADGKTWQACDIAFKRPDLRLDGSAANVSITIPNISLLLASFVEVRRELVGKLVTLTLAHSANLSMFSGGWSHSIQHRCSKVTITEKEATLECDEAYGNVTVPRMICERANTPGAIGVKGGR